MWKLEMPNKKFKVLKIEIIANSVCGYENGKNVHISFRWRSEWANGDPPKLFKGGT